MNPLKKLQTIFRLVVIFFRRPKEAVGAVLVLLDQDVKVRTIRRHGCPEGIPSIDLLDLVPDFRETVSPIAFLEGGSPVLDLGLLKALARRVPDCRYFEIGSWRGESVANVAAVARECFALSLSDEAMLAGGWGQPFVDTARFFSQGLSNVTHLSHDSRTFDFTPYHGAVDLVFVDGDHTYEGVRSDTVNAFRLLRNDNSVIVWHDYMRSPERDIDWNVLGGILDGCPPEKRGRIFHVSNTLCAVYVPGDFRGQIWRFPALPNKLFKVEIIAGSIPTAQSPNASR